MTENEHREEQVAHFEVTIRLPEESPRLPAEMDLDVLIPPREFAEQGLILAVATFDEIDRYRIRSRGIRSPAKRRCGPESSR